MQTGKDGGARVFSREEKLPDICLYTDVLQEWAHRKPVVSFSAWLKA